MISTYLLDSINKNDVFPEEFPAFLISDLHQRRLLTTEHPELFDYQYWKAEQEKVLEGNVADYFPYSRSIRFCNLENKEKESGSV